MRRVRWQGLAKAELAARFCTKNDLTKYLVATPGKKKKKTNKQTNK